MRLLFHVFHICLFLTKMFLLLFVLQKKCFFFFFLVFLSKKVSLMAAVSEFN